MEVYILYRIQFFYCLGLGLKTGFNIVLAQCIWRLVKLQKGEILRQSEKIVDPHAATFYLIWTQGMNWKMN